MERPGSRAKLPRTARGSRRHAGPFLVGALLGASCAAAREERPPYALEIAERNRHLEEQFRAGNLLGVADIYADSAVLIDARGNRVTGRDEIDEYWARIESPLDWKLEVRRVFGSDTLAYEIGRSHLTTLEEGKPRTSVVDFLLLWQREPSGEWKIVLDAYWPVQTPR